MVTPPPSRVRPLRRPDESMSLLNDLFAKPLEPGYEEVAARQRGAGEAAPSGSMPGSSPALMIGLMVLGLLLTIAVIQVRDTAGLVSAERQELIDRIHSEDDQVSRLEDSAAALESDIRDLEHAQLQDSVDGQQLRDETERLQARSGSLAVSGPGVIVRVDNADDYENAENPALARVLDLDLLQVVNGLWAAGAEAISINGQRITGATAIRSADNVIKINYRPMDTPFEVIAIGDSRSLAAKFGEGAGGQWLRAASQHTGIQFSVNTEDSLTAPASNASLLYAQPTEGAL